VLERRGNWRIIAEFTEVERGKRSDHPALDEAVAAAPVHQVPLVVAKVDRLTRSVAFLLRLFDRGEGPNGTTGPPIRRVPFVSGCPVRPPIRTENPIPKEMDHREIAVRVPMMHEVQLLFSPEPCKPLQPRFFYVVFLVEEDVRVKRRRTCDYLNHEEIDWQQQVCTGSRQKHRDEEEGRIVAFVTEVRP
jgi:hypothetical protein